MPLSTPLATLQPISSVMTSSAVIGLSGLVATYIFLRFLLSYTHGEKEPAPVATELPFLSPIIGMTKKAKFYTDLR